MEVICRIEMLDAKTFSVRIYKSVHDIFVGDTLDRYDCKEISIDKNTLQFLNTVAEEEDTYGK